MTVSALAAAPDPVAMPRAHQLFLDQYCLECHDTATEKGGVDLESLPFELATVESAELWQKVLNSLNSGEMPPEKKEQPRSEELKVFLQDLSGTLVSARQALADTGGATVVRRLNRREYENTMEALLGVEVDASSLPDDANPGGFDTSGGGLFFSSDQFEQYLAIATQALDEAVRLGPKPKPVSQHLEPEVSLNKFYAKQVDSLSANWEKAQAWRATEGKKEPSEFGLLDESDVQFRERLYRQQHQMYVHLLERPESKTGVLLGKLFNGAVVTKAQLSKKWPLGAYRLKVRAGRLPAAGEEGAYLEYGRLGGGSRSGEMEVLGCVKVTGTVDQPQWIEIPVTVTQHGGRDYGLRERQPNNRDATRTIYLQSQVKTGLGPEPTVWVDSLTIEGPVDLAWPPRAVKEIFFKGMPWEQEDQDAYAREVIERFAKRAFRFRAPTPAYVDRLYTVFRAGVERGLKFWDALREPLAVILASPGFLYLLEPAVDDQPRQLSARELAVRLSYFLWSAPPDGALANAGKTGALRDPEKLAHHTRRMLKDPRADAFIAAFAHQWLHMERLDFFQVDFRNYPNFDESVKEAARREVFATMRHILDAKRPIADLLNPGYVVVNDLLADYYGIEGVEGSDFRKVRVASDSKRGGLLGMAAVHVMGSDGIDSSPVERGAWVMRYLLNDPPPPAPPNVPQLSRVKGKLLTPREELAAHMEEAQCAQCHQRIDPIGHGMENFDPSGQWRDTLALRQVVKRRVTKKRDVPVDPSGQLPDGTPFGNFLELREAVATHDEAFTDGFVEALIAYALGRPYGFSDEALKEKILSVGEDDQPSMRELIVALVQSRSFQMKK